MKQEKLISMTVEEFDKDWPPVNANECVAWFQNKLQEIPEEFRSNAQIKFDTTYDHDIPRIKISYFRPETDEEEVRRVQGDAMREEYRRNDELQVLARLQAKYGKKND